MGSLIGVQNGVAPPRVVRLSLDRAGQRITAVTLLDRNHPQAPEPTIGTVWNNRYFYVANSQWEAYDDAGRLRAGVRLEPPRILELKLPWSAAGPGFPPRVRQQLSPLVNRRHIVRYFP